MINKIVPEARPEAAAPLFHRKRPEKNWFLGSTDSIIISGRTYFENPSVNHIIVR